MLPDESAILTELAGRGTELLVLLLLMSRANGKIQAAVDVLHRQVNALASSLGVALVDGVHVQPVKKENR